MKWRRVAPSQIDWHRKFALWPWYDIESGHAYWLEYIWVRWQARDNDDNMPWLADVRVGRDCPALKCEPVPNFDRTVIRRRDYGLWHGYSVRSKGRRVR